ncbi:MAG: glycosyl hydrolase [Saprospiraceae bacterium]|nr:glycosyl hydrolase [Saprospiraceae bacterium]
MRKQANLYPSLFRLNILRFCSIPIVLLFGTTLFAQPAPTPAESRLQGFEQRKNLEKNSLLAALKPESIGPSVFSGRVTDVDVNPHNPAEMYVAYASGGLWHTESNGTAFKPVFDQETSMTIGDIAVNWKSNIIWVGTGEVNSSRSSYAGTGIYRSADNGATWEWRGLPESHHIGRIVLHPSDPNTLWVAVLGHLYSPNSERGVFKTMDGGKNWQRILFVNENTGAIDLVIDPNDPDILYAATWERSRRAWNFDGAGEGSGIWKSSDGGENWVKISTTGSKFPTGSKIGRIGLAVGRANGKTVLYACLDNQNPKPKKEKPTDDLLTKDQLRSISKEDFLKISDEKLAEFLKQNRFPEKYTTKQVKGLIEKDKLKPIALVEYLEDANNNLFETDYIGAEVYRSNDGGATWRRTHDEPLEMMNFTYGYYFSNIRCLPDNPDKVYLIGFYIIRSDDGGKIWKNINGDNVHVDHHALWLNPAKPGHLVNGNDGGLNISWDDGASWLLCNTPPVGQFYTVAVDEAEPYNVYGGTQDNGVWVGPSTYKASTDWHATGHYPYKPLLGGDGMQVQVDFRDNNTVYAGYQFGNYFRINRTTTQRKPITPRHELGERPLRFNWQTPIHLSRHQQDVLYLGANKVYRSFNRGDDWEAISHDLTHGGQTGNVPYGTLTSIHESPLKFGLLYAGSDDGLLHLTRDGGETWTRISDNLPPKMWVSRVQASAHERARVYVSLNGYRWDDFAAYLYVSENYGQNWERIGLDLPAEPINVVREDPSNPDLLFVGTDHNLYLSLDRGKTFQTLSAELPKAPVHDLAIQPKAKHLIAGTHGRSLFKVDISNVQQINAEVLASTLTLFDIEKRKFSKNWGKKEPYQAAKDPELPIWFFANSAGKATWTVKNKEGGQVLNTGKLDCARGLNTFHYNLDIQEQASRRYKDTLQAAQKDPAKTVEIEKADTGKLYLQKGVYTFTLEKDGKTASKEFVIE